MHTVAMIEMRINLFEFAGSVAVVLVASFYVSAILPKMLKGEKDEQRVDASFILLPHNKRDREVGGKR